MSKSNELSEASQRALRQANAVVQDIERGGGLIRDEIILSDDEEHTRLTTTTPRKDVVHDPALEEGHHEQDTTNTKSKSTSKPSSSTRTKSNEDAGRTQNVDDGEVTEDEPPQQSTSYDPPFHDNDTVSPIHLYTECNMEQQNRVERILAEKEGIGEYSTVARMPLTNTELKYNTFVTMESPKYLSDEFVHAWWELLEARQRMYVGDWVNPNDWMFTDKDMPQTNMQSYTDKSEESIFSGTYRRCEFLNNDFLIQIIQKERHTSRHRVPWLTAHHPWDLERTDAIFIPANLTGDHWCLVIINIRDQHFLYFDSKHNGVPTELGEKIRKWLRFEVRQLPNHRSLLKKLRINKWKFHDMRNYTPFQRDNNSCGVRMLMNAEMISRGRKPVYDDNVLPKARLHYMMCVMDRFIPTDSPTWA